MLRSSLVGQKASLHLAGLVDVRLTLGFRIRKSSLSPDFKQLRLNSGAGALTDFGYAWVARVLAHQAPPQGITLMSL